MVVTSKSIRRASLPSNPPPPPPQRGVKDTPEQFMTLKEEHLLLKRLFDADLMKVRGRVGAISR